MVDSIVSNLIGEIILKLAGDILSRAARPATKMARKELRQVWREAQDTTIQTVSRQMRLTLDGASEADLKEIVAVLERIPKLHPALYEFLLEGAAIGRADDAKLLLERTTRKGLGPIHYEPAYVTTVFVQSLEASLRARILRPDSQLNSWYSCLNWNNQRQLLKKILDAAGTPSGQAIEVTPGYSEGTLTPIQTPDMEKLAQIRQIAADILAPVASCWWADQSLAHSERVIQILGQLLKSASTPPLTPQEQAVLWACAYLHNIGMSLVDLGRSSTLQAKYALAYLQDLTGMEREQLLLKHHPNISAEMIGGILPAPGQEAGHVLGSSQDDLADFVNDIAEVCKYHHATMFTTLAARTATGIRRQLLAALLALANELDLGYMGCSLEELNSDDKSPETLRCWLQHYVERVEIKEGRIRLHYAVPAGTYGEPVRVLVAVQPFLVYQAAIDILWDAGIRVVWVPASVAITATQKAMPPTLFNFMVEEAERVRRELLQPHLGPAKLPRLPEASPFCCTGVISPLQFRWRIPGRYTSYRVSVHDPAVSVHDTFAKSREIWAKECTQGPLDYDGPTLASEHLFAWRLAGIRDSSRELLAEGVFWMHSAPALPEWVQDLMRQEPDPAGRALTLAQWQVRERLYEAALGHYAEAINASQGQHEELVPAHAQIGLSLTYRKMAEELDELTKPHGSAWSYIADALNARAVRHAEEVVPAAKSRSR